MKRNMRFCMAFFLALGAMISFAPRAGKARETDEKNEVQFGVAQYFERTWEYLEKAVRANEQK